MKNLTLTTGEVITNPFSNTIFQTEAEALQFVTTEMGWTKKDILYRNQEVSVLLGNHFGPVRISLDCILVDSGSEDYIYYIN